MGKRFVLVVMGCCLALGMAAQQHLQQLADSVVKYQMKSGGWPKNQDWLRGVDPKEAMNWRKTGIGSTIDNGATTSEMETLAKVVAYYDKMAADVPKWVDKDVVNERKLRYCESFKRGLAYLLKMQYANGGFPQFYPEKRAEDYSTQITFNDNAMVNVLKLLRDVANEDARFSGLGIDKGTKKKCRAAYEKGVRCVLDCQIRVDESGRVLDYGTEAWRKGKRTVWCQQHDKQTFAPVKARAYELPSYTGNGETCAILDMLMDEEEVSEEVREAVKCGVEWLEAHAMKDVAVERFTNEEGQRDIRLVKEKDAPLLWARFYDLEKGEPMFCDRDGVPRKSLSEVGYERRNGYSWVGDGPARVIERYKRWK
ncbi:MAG: pectate lyase [Bacteroidaceae bacterium]|nr:pectate lyase [Bacteroidaceae bacterium]